MRHGQTTGDLEDRYGGNDELTTQEKDAIFILVGKIKNALKGLFGAEGFHFAWNEEKIAGQSVPHSHPRVVPRKKGDEGITEYEPRKFLYRPGFREPSPEAELKAVSRQIQEALLGG